MRASSLALAAVGFCASGAAFAVTFNVDSPVDAPDALPGDGKCSFQQFPPPNGCTPTTAPIWLRLT